MGGGFFIFPDASGEECLPRKKTDISMEDSYGHECDLRSWY